MRKYLLLALVAVVVQLNAQSVDELQAEIQALQEQNQILQNKADFCELYSNSDQFQVKSFLDAYEVKVLSVKGNRNEQTVEILFTLKHQLPNQTIHTNIRNFSAFDEMGKSYGVKNIEIASKNDFSGILHQPVIYNQLTQGKIIIRNVLPNIDRFSKFNGMIATANQDGGDNRQEGELTLTNLVIDWQ